MVFWCMSFIRFLMLDFGIFSFVSLSMECSCMAPLTHAMMVIRGLVFIHYFGWYYLKDCIWCVFV